MSKLETVWRLQAAGMDANTETRTEQLGLKKVKTDQEFSSVEGMT